jgi:predicted membrane protein
MKMNGALYINTFSAIVSVVMGLLLLIGIVLPQIETTSRLVFGAIFLSYGIYRLLNVQSKRKAMKQEEEHERMKQAQEELIQRLKDSEK